MDSRTARIVAEEFNTQWHKSGGSGESLRLYHDKSVWSRIADRLEQEEAKAKGPFEPFKAWVVVDNGGNKNKTIYLEQSEADRAIEIMGSIIDKDRAPFRVVPVLVTPVKED